jgi:hypothetical protein
MGSTLEEERREVWSSIVESLQLPADQDREAACNRLLRHLAASGPGPSVWDLPASARVQ